MKTNVYNTHLTVKNLFDKIDTQFYILYIYIRDIL